MADKPARTKDLLKGRGIAFLVSQVGAQSSRVWNRRVKATGFDSRVVMVLWNVAMAEGRSQIELARSLHLPGTRIVALVDVLEAEGLLERRISPRDRRRRELHVTRKGQALVDRILKISSAHEAEFTDGLTARERAQLLQLLGKVARARGLLPTVHPDF